jgi:glycosyltransferase involved in cell wall biosynthesis
MTASQVNPAHRKKIVLVTDVPFWRAQTGAQQRILGLTKFLADRAWQVSIAYLGTFSEEPPSQFEKKPAADLKFVSLVDDWQPQGFVESALWKLKCIGNSISRRSIEQSATESKRLSEFENPIFRQRFHEFVRREKPEIVIVEYASLSYLVPPRGQRAGTQYWVDTHDLLSSRCRQFQDLGLPHWIEISELEEATVLKQFDGIIAIESSEADKFRSFTQSRIPVVVAGHASPMPTNSPRKATDETALGIIASANRINHFEIRRFLKEVWPKVIRKSFSQPIRLILAGSISNELGEFAELSGVQLIGVVGELEEFYDQIQIAINPIQFGTGLKIKCIEGLSFGKPVIAARHSIAGLRTEFFPLPFIATDTPEEMVAAILELASDQQRLKQLSEAAFAYADRFLGPEVVYRDLAEQFCGLRS